MTIVRSRPQHPARKEKRSREPEAIPSEPNGSTEGLRHQMERPLSETANCWVLPHQLACLGLSPVTVPDPLEHLHLIRRSGGGQWVLASISCYPPYSWTGGRMLPFPCDAYVKRSHLPGRSSTCPQT